MYKNFKKILTITTASFLTLSMIALVSEPIVAVAATASDNVVVTLNVTSGVSISDATNITMTPNISMTQNKSIGSTAWTVSTNSATGYTLAVKQSTATALTSTNGDNFANYTEATPGTPDAWGNVASSTKEFGFSAYGTNVPTGTWGTQTTGCGNTSTGVPESTLKYRGFLSAMTDIQVASSGSPTPVGGTVSNVCFAAEQNGTYARSGAYTATITATATAS